jgi:hypothetical protein
MKSVSQARNILIAIAAIFLLVDIVAAIVLFSPAGRSPAQRSFEFQQLRIERQQKEAETRPTRDMDKKLATTRDAIGEFFKDRLPANYSDISENLGKTAAANHVVISQVHYDTHPSGISGLENIAITVTMTGDYTAEMNFINALEREKRFYVLDRVVIGESGNTGNQLAVSVQLETFLRNAS